MRKPVKRINFLKNVLEALFLLFFLAPQAFAADGDLNSQIEMYDTNANGKIDRFVVEIENAGVTTGHVYSTDGWVVTDNGNPVTVSSAVISGDPANDPITVHVDLDENDPDLTVDTANPYLELSYVQQAVIGKGTWVNAGGYVEIAAIVADDSGYREENDLAPPIPVSAIFYDSGTADGTIDLVMITWSEDIGAIATGTTGWTASSASDFASPSVTDRTCGGSGAEATNQCRVVISTSTVKTDVGDLALSYNAVALTISDSNSNTAASQNFHASSAVPLSDGAAPFPVGADAYDTDKDGKLDLVTATWSEPIVSVADGSGDWQVSSPGVQFADLTEGVVECNNGSAAANECDNNFTTTTVKTDLGDLQVNYTAGSSVKDAANNLAATAAAITLADKAAPVIKDIAYVDALAGIPNGKISHLLLTFSESVSANSVLADNDLIISNTGDFTGTVIGTDNTNLIVGAPISSVTVDFGTEATAADTHDDSGNFMINSRLNYYLEDTSPAANSDSTLRTQTQATVTDSAAPVIREMKYEDTDDDGYIDQFVATFTETAVAASVLGANDLIFSSGGTDVGDFTGAAFGGAGNVISGDTITATIPLGTPANVTRDTYENSGSISIDSQNAFDLIDADSNSNTSLGTLSHIVYVDGAAPVALNVNAYDYDGPDGLLDTITVQWTEVVNVVDDGLGDWSLSGSDFAGLSVDSVTCGGSSFGSEATDECDISFTTTTVKTDIGNLTLNYTGSSVTDGTNATVAATYDSGSAPALSDSAAPVFVSAAADSDTNINIIMSEPVNAVTFGDAADWAATGITATGVALDGSGGIDLTISSLGNRAFSASDFTYNDSAGLVPAIQDSATNATPPFSGKAIADGQAPAVTVGTLNIDDTACSSTTCKIGDPMTFSWDNSIATGDGNTDVATVTADLSNFGGSATQTLYDDGTHGDATAGDDIYSYLYTVLADTDDNPAATFTVTATDTSTNSATSGASADTADIDNEAPVIGTPGSLAIPVDSNTVGVAEIGDEVAYTNAVESTGDTISSYTIDLSLLTGDVAATQGSNYVVIPGTLHTTYAFTETVTDDAGNEVTGFVNAIQIDNATGSGFNSASVSIGDLNSDASTYADISFNANIALPGDGKITITFPAGFDVSGVNTVSNEVNIETGLAVSNLGLTVTLTRPGTSPAISSGTNVSFRISPVVTPDTGGTTSAFGLMLKDNADVTQAGINTIPGVTIIAPPTPPVIPVTPPVTPNVVIGGGGGGGGGGGSYVAGLRNKNVATEGEGDEGAAGTAVHSAAPATIAAFRDTFGHWARPYIDQIAALGIVEGKTPTTYAPNDNISRAEILKIALRSFNLAVEEEIARNPLPDVDADAWYAPYVKTAFENGIIYGFNSGLEPNAPASRGMAVTILAKAAGFEDVEQNFADNYSGHPGWTYAQFPDVTMDAYYAPFVAYLYDHGIIDGYQDGTFGPGNPITRGEIAKIVVNILNFLTN